MADETDSNAGVVQIQKKVIVLCISLQTTRDMGIHQSRHFIQPCPTNGVPEFDVKRVKPPTGIPKLMLMPTPEGSYAVPSGAVAVLKPNEAAFEKEIAGLPSNRPVRDLPPEL